MPISETLLTRVSRPSRTWIHASSFISGSQHACVYTASPKLSDRGEEKRRGKTKETPPEIRNAWAIEKELIRLEETCFSTSIFSLTNRIPASWTRRYIWNCSTTKYSHYRSKYYSGIPFRGWIKYYLPFANILSKIEVIENIGFDIIRKKKSLYTRFSEESAYSINITIFISC